MISNFTKNPRWTRHGLIREYFSFFLQCEDTKNRRHSANITVYRIRFSEKIPREFRRERARAHPCHTAAERDGGGTHFAST